MNYEIAPGFTYIRRATAVRAAMKSESPLAIPNAASKVYKLWDHETNDFPLGLPNTTSDQDPQVSAGTGTRRSMAIRRSIRCAARYLSMTRRRLLQEDRTPRSSSLRITSRTMESSGSAIPRSAICIWSGRGEKLSDYQSGQIWPNYLPTGDNTRERPYTNLYAKLTTKSNTFTVHFRVQVLQKNKAPNVNYAQWSEGVDQIVSDYRGSSLIERYIDAEGQPAGFRRKSERNSGRLLSIPVVSTKKFAP